MADTMLISAEVCSSSESHAKAVANRWLSHDCPVQDGEHGFFVHGFGKSEKANVSAIELKSLRQLADVLLGFSDEELQTAQRAGELIEVVADDEEQEG